MGASVAFSGEIVTMRVNPEVSSGFPRSCQTESVYRPAGTSLIVYSPAGLVLPWYGGFTTTTTPPLSRCTLPKMQQTPTRSKATLCDAPASYNPRSKRLPSNIENTLWKNGSRFGKLTVEPAGTASTCGSKRFLCWSISNFPGAAGSALAPPAAFSHTTALEESDSFCDFPANDNVTIPCTVTCAAALPIATNSARGRMDVRDTIKTESPRRD